MARTSVAREILTIRRSFAQLAAAFERIGPVLTERETEVLEARKAMRPRRVLKLSAKRRANLEVQGKYMGTMRGLKPAQRAVIKKIRLEEGIAAAIKEAQRLARRDDFTMTQVG
ncbi:MAG: hypothetical protein ACREAA_00480 [Candidatus Polarisedimenticolia bacterium]